MDGYFAENSVTRRVLNPDVSGIAGGRALLMQFAHPLAAQALVDSGGFQSDPKARLNGTAAWVNAVVFGSKAEADAQTRRVRGIHGRVRGTLDAANATDRVAAGTPYRAANRELVRWVHATLVDSILTVHDALAGTLSDAERDALVREWNVAGAMMGLRPADEFTGNAQLKEYIRGQIESGPIKPSAASRAVAGTLFSEQLTPSPVQRKALTIALQALLPAKLRDEYGYKWGPMQQFAWKAMARQLRKQIARAKPATDGPSLAA